jgi:hypothetical protein
MGFKQCIPDNKLLFRLTRTNEPVDPKLMSERYTNEFHASRCCEKWECLLLGYTMVSQMMRSFTWRPRFR